MDVWRASIGAEETDVRLKAAECAAIFAGALDVPERANVLEDLAREFSTGKLRGWREREEVMKSLPSFLDIRGVDEDVLRRLLMQGLGDRVSAIREAAVSVVCLSCMNVAVIYSSDTSDARICQSLEIYPAFDYRTSRGYQGARSL